MLVAYRARKFGVLWSARMLAGMALGRWRDPAYVEIAPARTHRPLPPLASAGDERRRSLILNTPLKYRIRPRSLRVLAFPGWAAGPRAVTRIDHISDLHFDRVDERAVEALLDALNADPAHLVVLSGDLTMRARRREFARAAEFMAALKAPRLAVPGNHDITPFALIERFTDPFGRWRDLVCPEVEPDWSNDQVAVLGLNTVSRGGFRRNWADGRVHRGRLVRLLRRIRDVSPRPDGGSKVRIVVAHHPLLAPVDQPDASIAEKAERALKAFAREGVRLVLSGHLHRGYARDFAVGSDSGPALTVLQAGSATSTRLRGEPNAYNRVTVENGVTRWEARSWTGSGWESATVPHTPLIAALED